MEDKISRQVFQRAFRRDLVKLFVFFKKLDRRLCDALGAKTSIYYVLGLAIALRGLWIVVTPELAFSGALEESLLQLAAARNWIQFGFWSTFFLPDYVTSPVASQHAVVYTHFPPLSALIPATFLYLGFGLKIVRFFFAFINVLGIFYLYKFMDRIFGMRAALIGAIICTFTYGEVFSWHDHFDYSFTLFLLFFPAYMLFREKQTVLTLLWIALAVFVASILNYKILFTQVTMLFVLSFFAKRSPIPIVATIIFISTLFGIGLHLYQNVLHLGWEVAYQEILLTLKNRIFGFPTTPDLQTWFRQHNIVLWGAPDKLGLVDYVKAISMAFVKQWSLVGSVIHWYVVLALFVVWRYFAVEIQKSKLHMLFWVFIAGGMWGVIFPAHAKGYNLSVTLVAAPLMLATYVCGLVVEGADRSFRRARSLLMLCVLVLIVQNFIGFKNQFVQGLRFESSQEVYYHLRTLERYRGKVTWTNMTSIWVGYFMNQVVPGRCTIRSVEDHDLSQCLNVNINSNYDQTEFTKPEYFIFSKLLRSGNMVDATPERLIVFENLLNKNLELIEKTEYFSVYKFKKE